VTVGTIRIQGTDHGSIYQEIIIPVRPDSRVGEMMTETEGEEMTGAGDGDAEAIEIDGQGHAPAFSA
jgi:hypothetical protein